jgi:predicted RecB family nuclease
MVWQDWQASVKLRPLAIEQVVWSTTHRFAGTLDFLAEITLPGHAAPVYVVGDIKTGKAIYDEARLQVAAYVAALREMEHAPPGVWAAGCGYPKSRPTPSPRSV